MDPLPDPSPYRLPGPVTTRERIIELLSSDYPLPRSMENIARGAGKKIEYARRTVQTLIEQGLVRRYIPRRRGYTVPRNPDKWLYKWIPPDER